ncbi:MAG: hypothetical protein MUC38_00090 [Cyclobacteriaceae bacterium]|jgi:hypothetical protein|nr:hypothetical protein [Cyclobacteriaceae bacterium]
MNVLVFKTSVQSTDQVKQLRPLLNKLAGRGRWNFALDDGDKILRVVSDRVSAEAAMHVLRKVGFECCELD